MDKERGDTVTVAIVGAALSANKGASAMAESVIARLPDWVGPCEFALLTTYPNEDRSLISDPSVRVVSLTPPMLAFYHVPLGILSAGLRRLRLPYRWLLRSDALRTLDRSDVVVDVAGISFVDGRGVPTLAYNSLMTGLPLLLGRPVVKTSQAIGPIRQRLTRIAARVVLPRVQRICARGQGTREHLDEFGLTNVTNAADITFALPESERLDESLEGFLADELGGGEFVVLMPSQVVAGLCTKAGIEYVNAMATVVNGVQAKLGLPVVIAPHSYRTGRGPDRMNDGPIARDLAKACDSENVHLIDRDIRPQALRALVDRSSLLVTSRFHGMVSGLATATPTVVVGWSHKYREVMSDFGVDRLGLSHDELKAPSTVVDAIVDAWEDRESLIRSMRQALPQVQEATAHNFEAIAGALSESDES